MALAFGDLFGAELVSVFPKGKGYFKFLKTTPDLNPIWHIIIVSYYLQNLVTNFSSHIHFLFSSPFYKLEDKKSQNKLGKQGKSA